MSYELKFQSCAQYNRLDYEIKAQQFASILSETRREKKLVNISSKSALKKTENSKNDRESEGENSNHSRDSVQ